MYPLVKENDDAAATQNILLDQMTGEDSPVDKLVGEGNTQDLAQYITGLSTTLNKLKDKENLDKQNLNNTGKDSANDSFTRLQSVRSEVSLC